MQTIDELNFINVKLNICTVNFEKYLLCCNKCLSYVSKSCFMQNELCRMKLDVSILDDLVHEYCVYRGIVDSGFASGE